MSRPDERFSAMWGRALWALVLFLVVVAVAIVVRRATHLVPSGEPARFPGAGDLDRGFFAHPRLTMLHIWPALLFVLLTPLQFVQRLRDRHPAWHRWNGRVCLIAGLVTGVTALIMSPQMAIGGMNETVATILFALLFLFALVQAYRSIRRRRIAAHREWMIRAFAIGLAVTTVRPVVGIFFATSRWTHLGPHEFFGTAFWIGFVFSAAAAEVWINVSPH